MESQFTTSLNGILTALGPIAFAVGSLAVGWVIWRLKSDETWKQVAERRKVRTEELEKELDKLRGKLDHLEIDCERFEQRYFRELAKVEWYEKKHGLIPPDAL